MRSRFTPLLVLVGLALLPVTWLVVGAASAQSRQMPYAVGDDAANIPLDSADEAIVLRWVARHTGVLDRLLLRVKVEGSRDCPYGRRPGYAAGTSGVLLATTSPVLPSGAPDTGRVLREEHFRPCGREQGESVSLDLHLPVSRGQEFATVVRNVDAAPEKNWFSLNFLFQRRGITGPNGRNERRTCVRDAAYDLDPRELVGWSTDAGQSWRLPGGPYGGRRGASFLPTYIQAYADGYRDGQPYYYAHPARGRVDMIYAPARHSLTITRLGAYTYGFSSGVVRIRVDDKLRASARLRGRGRIAARIRRVRVPAGATLRVSTRAGAGGLKLLQLYADADWDDTLRLGSSFRYHLRQDPADPVTVYPLGPWTSPGQIACR